MDGCQCVRQTRAMTTSTTATRTSPRATRTSLPVVQGPVVQRPAVLPVLDSPAGRAVACCAPLVREPLTAVGAEQLAGVLKALADPARLRLLSMIAAHEGGEACVCDLTEPLGLSQPTVSHHLKVLLEAGLVSRDKRGVWAYYRLVDDALTGLAALLSASTSRQPAVLAPQP